MKLLRHYNIGWVIFIAFLVISVGRVYFHSGFPYTHDGENHLARFANYKIALKEGQFPPRLAPNLLNHFSYPVFNFNYPLANLMSVPFSLIKLNYELSFKILALTALVVAALATNLWLSTLGLSGGARKFALATLFSAPFLINTIWFRGNIGELWAIALFPLALWLTEAWLRKPQQQQLLWGLGATAAAILLAHNIAALMLTPLLIMYGLFVVGWKNKLRVIGTWLLALLSTLWFWLPALAEKNTIVLDDAKFFQDYANYFVTPAQLLTAPLEFGFVYFGSISGLNLSLGFLTWLVLGLSLIGGTLLLKKRLNHTELRAVLLTLLCLGLIYLQTQQSLWLWNLVPVLKYLQFPWRLSLPLIVLVLPLAAFWWQWAHEHRAGWLKVLLVTLLAVQFVQLFKLKAVDYFHKTVVDYDAYGQTTSTLNENLPKGFRFIEFGDWQPTPQILEGAGTISVKKWSGTERRYELVLTENSIIVEPSIVWLGFETTANTTRVSYLDSDTIQGRLAYALPPGSYSIVTAFTQNTWARRVGNGVSAVTILCSILWIGASLKRRSHD